MDSPSERPLSPNLDDRNVQHPQSNEGRISVLEEEGSREMEKNNKLYDQFMILSIFGNSLCLALTDYTDDNNVTKWNQNLDLIDKIFTIVYTLEACMKIIAFGFVIHQRSYLRDPWNVLDFVVVIIGLTSLIPAVPNLKSLRTMRVLRPLRSINAVPSMKRLVKTLLLSLPQMGYLVSFLLFFIFIMAILGMQLFTRDLWKRCRTTPAPYFDNITNKTIWPIDYNQARLCGGIYECASGTYCGALLEYHIDLNQDHYQEWDFIQYGYFHFDNIGVSILSIFRVITLEGWTSVMYNYLDSSGFIAGIYFPILVIIGSFFLLQLFLAVIMETFSEMSNKTIQNEQKMAQLKKLHDKQQALVKEDKVRDMINITQNKLAISKKVGGLADAGSMMLALKSHKFNSSLLQKELKNDLMEQNQSLQSQQQDKGQDIDNMIAELEKDDYLSQKVCVSKSNIEKQLKPNNSPPRKVVIDEENEDDGESVDLDQQLDSKIKVQTEEVNKIVPMIKDGVGDTNSPFDSSRPPKNENKFEFKWQFFRNTLKQLCENTWFTLMINISIIVNTFILSCDQYPIDEDLQNRFDIINLVFSAIFLIEMIVKLIGLGPKRYVTDRYNIFDSIVVSISIIDVAISYSMPGDDSGGGKGAISAFRAFRLLRVFKLAKSWKTLNQLLQTIMKSLKDISSFSVLLFLLMLIYTLLGMEAFALPGSGSTSGLNLLSTVPLRGNFNNFFNGIIVIFTVLTGENWDQTMFQFANQAGYIAIFFFVSLIIIGQMIFLNLFLAILLENFDDNDVEEEDSGFSTIFENKSAFQAMIKEQFLKLSSWFQKLFEKKQQNGGAKKLIITEGPLEEIANKSGPHELANGNDSQTLRLNIRGLRQVQIEPEIVDDQESISMPPLSIDDGQSIGGPTNQYPKMASNLEVIEEINEEKSPMVYGGQQFNNINKNGQVQFSGVGRVNNYKNFGLPESQQQTTLHDKYGGQSSRTGGLAMDNYSEAIQDGDSQNGTKTRYFIGLGGRSPRGIEFENSPEIMGSALPQFLKRGRTMGESKSKFAESFNNQVQPPSYLAISQKIESQIDQQSSSAAMSPSKHQRSVRSKTVNVAIEIHSRLIKPPNIISSQEQNIQLEGYSMLCISTTNPIRVKIARVVKNSKFEGIILFMIAFSSVLLALDNPLNDPQSTLAIFLKYSDIILTVFFSIEAVFKIITYGLLFNNKGAYLRNGWNAIDFVVVIVSIISLAITSNKLKIVKILRLLRVLRPLRVISRNKGLKIGIQALFMAIPALFNVLIVSCLFYLIFGIIGVNYFKGTFFSCEFDPSMTFASAYSVDIIGTKFDCLNFGGSWVNADQHFDNVPQAMSTLFQLSTTEGWIDMMNRGIDAVAIDYQPIINENQAWSLFFIVFIILGNFLILNLFAGVVVSTFNRQKEILGKSDRLTSKQKLWLDLKKQCLNISPIVVLDDTESPTRKFLRNLIQSQRYDIFILSCTIINTTILTINWYSQSARIDDMLDYVNYAFAIIFALDCLFKFAALGFKPFFRDVNCQFDLIIVTSSIISTALSLVYNVDFGASTTFIRAIRIVRIFKYTKSSRQIKVIFETLYVTIPALTNIGGLLLLFLYIYSVLGVFLFSEIELQNNLDEHANFQSFGLAFLTLLRCSTGESWDYIMADTVRQRQINFQCSESDFDYDQYEANGFQTNGCGSAAGLIFFMTYFLFVPLIFLNLFIAIILEGFEQTNAKAQSIIQDEDLDKFKECWSHFDKKGTGYLSIKDFYSFMIELGEPLGWDVNEYGGNQKLQDEFLEDINIPTYNRFSQFLFWDVIESLSKVYMIKMDMGGKLQQSSSMNESDQDLFKSQESQDDQETTKIGNDQGNIDPEEKLRLRLELEFENIDGNMQEVMDVEEIKDKENKIRKSYQEQKDLTYSSAHIKAARRIMQGLKNLRAQKLEKMKNSQLTWGDTPSKKEV